MQEDKERLALGGAHQELDQVFLIRKGEGDMGAGGPRHRPTGEGWERGEDDRVEEGRGADPAFCS